MEIRRRSLFTMERRILMGFVVLILAPCTLGNAKYSKGKRQIYREQVLPFKGGKIPESALRTDRLNLNQLQREGFSLPDGVVLNNRRHLRHPFPYHQEPELLKVYMTNDGRFISMYGKYTTDTPDTIDTTYLIRSPVQLDTYQFSSNSISEFPNERIFTPSILSLVIPTNAIYGNFMKENEDKTIQHNSNHIKPFNQQTTNNQNVPYKHKTNRQNTYMIDRSRSYNQTNNNRRNKNNQEKYSNISKKNNYDSKDGCSDCVHKTGYNGPKSRVWINRLYSNNNGNSQRQRGY